MDQGAELWMYKTAKKNFWRVSGLCDFDDLVQEGHYCYALIRKKYPDVSDAAHLMRLFQTTFINHIHWLSNTATKQGVRLGATREDALPKEELCSDAEMFRLIAEAPAAVGALLKNVISDPKKLKALYRTRLDGTRETMNERFCAIVGVDPKDHDLRGALYNYLRGYA